MPESKIGELAALFEIIVGQTPKELDPGGPSRNRPRRPLGSPQEHWQPQD